MKKSWSKSLRVLFFGLACCATTRAASLEDLQQQVDAFDRSKLPPHPRMVLTKPEQARVRAATQTDWGKKHWDIVRRFVDDGRALTPPSDPEGYKDKKWNVDDWRRIVHVGQVYQDHILTASFAAVVTGEAGDVAEARRWTLAAAKLDPVGTTGINSVDHPARDILHAMSLSYDWLYDQYSPDERKVIRDAIAARGRAMYKYLNPVRGDSWNNHVWFQTSSLADAGLAIADELAEADQWWRYAAKLYFTDFLPKGGRDGDWHEGTHYVVYTLMFVYEFAAPLKSATGIDPYQIPLLQKVGRFSMMISPPAGGGIQFNDNNFIPPNVLDQYCAYVAARNTRDPALQWYGDAIRSNESQPRLRMGILIERDDSVKPLPPGKDVPLGEFYRDAGWAVFRTDLSSSEDVQFGLKGGKYYGSAKSRGHDHPDQNGFLLNYLGEPLAVDSGYYDWYGSPHHNGWTFTGKAHNTLLVDGREQLVGKDGQILSFVSDNDSFSFVESEAAATYSDNLLTSWRRQVLFIRPDFFLIHDIVKPAHASTLTWLLHGPHEFSVTGQDLRVRNQKAELAARMIYPEGLKIDQVAGFPADAQPERKKPEDFPDQYHLSLTTPTPVGAGTFLFAMRPGTPGVALPKITRDASAPGEERITVGGDPNTSLLIADDPTRKHLVDHGLVAAAVYATLPAKDATAILASSVTLLTQGPQLIWESNHPADIAGSRDADGWRHLSIRLDQPTNILLHLREGDTIHLAGQEVKGGYLEGAKTFSLSLPPGSHILQIR